MDAFNQWNLRLLESFFSGASREEEVFLRVDRDLLDQIGQDIGGDNGFLQAVRRGPCWLNRRTSMDELVSSLVEQRNIRTQRPCGYKDPGELNETYNGLNAPTYLPYLAALVRNVAEDQPDGYYNRLTTDLQLEPAFNTQAMARLEPAWDDLHKWTEEIHGRFGSFAVRILGGYRRIGIPRSQIILNHRDLEKLPFSFLQAEILPGQELSEEDVTKIFEAARDAPDAFTAAFQHALNDKTFKQPICAAIAAAYVDWDGSLPKRNQVNDVAGLGGSQAGELESGFGLCLTVIRDDPLLLVPRWRVPPLQDSGWFKIKHCESGEVWDGSFAGSEGGGTTYNSDAVPLIWKIAEQTCNTAASFTINCFSNEDSDPTCVDIVLPQRELWILVAEYDGPNGCTELRERGLPGHGSAFLLAPPSKVSQLQDYLNREQPDHSFIVAGELPEGWVLVRLHNCGDLTPDQRRLPDGAADAHPTPRVIRFGGGRSVRRGYRRMYLPYDLPCLELDAPDQTQIEVPDEIQLTEESASGLNGGEFLPRRRFKIELNSFSSASYEIKAVLNSATLSKVKLRIAGEGGRLVRTDQAVGVDDIGRPVPLALGLSGIVEPASDPTAPVYGPNEEMFSCSLTDLGEPIYKDCFSPSARELFLDSLAQAGSLAYGAARDQIARLLHSAGEEGEPPLVLLELRSLGHLEISMSNKGHISRVHAVAPAIYELPILADDEYVYGITGTLRLEHWRSLLEESIGWRAPADEGRHTAIKPLRLVDEDHGGLRRACEGFGLRFSNSPAFAIAEWSSDIASIRDDIFMNPMESIGGAAEGAKRFNPGTGLFQSQPAEATYCQAWKISDLDTGMDNIYVLFKKGDFAFVRASRWGVWIALEDFAKWVSQYDGMQGVHPIPITYSECDGTLWLPARISLPFALERALVLCSGALPQVLQVTHCCDAQNRLQLSIDHQAVASMSVNRFYQEMALGKWLGYRWVPRSVAAKVVQKLGARLDVI